MAEGIKTLSIIYHSLTGGTQQMAQAAADGARQVGGVEVLLTRAAETHASHLLRADGFIFATPENLAAMSGMFKDFFDRTYYEAFDLLNGRPYLILVCAGSDGRSAARQVERIATGWRLEAIAEPLIICTQATSVEQILRPKTIAPEALAECRKCGETIASGMALGIF